MISTSQGFTIKGVVHEFLAPIKSQLNGVVKQNNHTLQEMARVMLYAKNLPYHFLAEAMNTACHIHNRITIQLGTKVTHDELWRVRKPNVKYFHMFRNICYIFADQE